MPGVSIIVCTFNDSEWLKKCLPSCASQPVEKEIILVDDCSTKPLDPYVTQAIQDYGIKYIRHERNQGLSASRNTGISNSKYDLIIPMDADDYFYPDVLSPMIDAMTDDADIVHGNVTDSGLTHYPIMEPFRRDHFLQRNPLFCSSLFRKKVWTTVGGYMVLPHAFYEDYNFWCKAFKHGFRFKYVPVTIYEHTSRPDSMLRQLHSDGEKFKRIALSGLD